LEIRELGHTDFTALYHFFLVAQYGSFSRAAVATSVSQPTLSRQVRSLEEELNVRLFDRTGRGVQLTLAGRRLLDSVRPGFEQLDAARRSAASRGDDAELHMAAIGVPPSIGNILLPPLLTATRERFPNMRLRIVEGFHRPLLDMLFQGRLDFALLYAMVPSAGIHLDRILQERLCLVGRPDILHGMREAPLEALGRFPLALPTRPHGLRELLETRAEQHGIQLQIRYEFDTSLALTRLAPLLGHAATILPHSAVHDEVARQTLAAVPICDPPLTRDIVFAYPNNRTASPGLWTLLQFVRQQCETLVQGGVWQGVVPCA